MSLACTPTLGTRGEFTKCQPEEVVQKYNEGASIVEFNKESESQYVLDCAANPHPRYHAAIENVKQHRGEKLNTQIPLFQDVNTNMTTPRINDEVPGMIHMDSVVFAGACQCL